MIIITGSGVLSTFAPNQNWYQLLITNIKEPHYCPFFILLNYKLSA